MLRQGLEERSPYEHIRVHRLPAAWSSISTARATFRARTIGSWSVTGASCQNLSQKPILGSDTGLIWLALGNTAWLLEALVAGALGGSMGLAELSGGSGCSRQLQLP